MSDDLLDSRRVERLARAAHAARTLSETLWEELHEGLADPRAGRVAEVSEQLGEIVAILASLARADTRAQEARGIPDAPDTPLQPAPRAPRMTDDRLRTKGESSTRESPAFSAPPAPREPAASRETLSPAVLVDELAPDGPAEIEIRDVRGERDGLADRNGSTMRRPSDYGSTQP